jgi:hypothetical protein
MDKKRRCAYDMKVIHLIPKRAKEKHKCRGRCSGVGGNEGELWKWW